MSEKTCYFISIYLRVNTKQYFLSAMLLERVGFESYFSTTDNEEPDQEFLKNRVPIESIAEKWNEISKALSDLGYSRKDIEDTKKALYDPNVSIIYQANKQKCEEDETDDTPVEDVTTEPPDTDSSEPDPEVPANDTEKCFSASFTVTYRFTNSDAEVEAKQHSINVFSSAESLPDPIDKTINSVDGIRGYLTFAIDLSEDEAADLVSPIKEVSQTAAFEIVSIAYGNPNFWIEDTSGVACADKDQPEPPPPPPPSPDSPSPDSPPPPPQKTTFTVKDECDNEITVTVPPYTVTARQYLDFKWVTHELKRNPKTGEYLKDAAGNDIYVPVKTAIKDLKQLLGPRLDRGEPADGEAFRNRLAEVFEPDPSATGSRFQTKPDITNPGFSLLFPKGSFESRPKTFSVPVHIDTNVKVQTGIWAYVTIDYKLVEGDQEIFSGSERIFLHDDKGPCDSDEVKGKDSIIVNVKNKDITANMNMVQKNMTPGEFMAVPGNVKVSYTLEGSNPSDDDGLNGLSYHDVVGSLWTRTMENVDFVQLCKLKTNPSEQSINNIKTEIEKILSGNNKRYSLKGERKCAKLCITNITIELRGEIYPRPVDNDDKYLFQQTRIIKK